MKETTAGTEAAGKQNAAIKNTKQQRIGLMGGTFNPIHNGHLLIAENAYEQFALSQVLFIPTGNSPHKDNRQILDGTHRGNMLKLAISNNPHFAFSDYELKQTDICYTYLTVEAMQKRYPDSSLYFIMGGDSLSYLDSWFHTERICQLATILAAVRDELDVSKLQPIRQMLSGKYQADVQFINAPNFSVSSHLIRQRIYGGSSVRYLVPDAVADYIAQNQLYKTRE